VSTTVPVTTGAPGAGTATHLATLGWTTVCRPDEVTTTVDVAPPAA
jgi:hypothetical protein